MGKQLVEFISFTSVADELLEMRVEECLTLVAMMPFVTRMMQWLTSLQTCQKALKTPHQKTPEYCKFVQLRRVLQDAVDQLTRSNEEHPTDTTDTLTKACGRLCKGRVRRFGHMLRKCIATQGLV